MQLGLNTKQILLATVKLWLAVSDVHKGTLDVHNP